MNNLIFSNNEFEPHSDNNPPKKKKWTLKK